MIKLGSYKGYKDVYIDTDKIPNKIFTLIGSSGAGKTLMIQNLILQLLEEEYTVIVFDNHGVFSEDQIHPAYKAKIDTHINNIDVLNQGIPYDLFQPIQYPDGTTEKDDICIGSILDIFSTAYNLQCKQRRELREALEYVRDRDLFNAMGFEAIYKALVDTKDESALSVADKLYYISKYNVFRAGNELFKPGCINVFRLSQFDLGTQIALEEIILKLFWRLANNSCFKAHPIYLVIDEAQNLPQKPYSALPTMISEGRRMGINLLIATQVLLKDTSSALFQRIGQAGVKLYFKQPSDRVALVAKLIDSAKADSYTRLLQNLTVGEFIVDSELFVEGKSTRVPIVVKHNLDEGDKEDKVDQSDKDFEVKMIEKA